MDSATPRKGGKEAWFLEFWHGGGSRKMANIFSGKRDTTTKESAKLDQFTFYRKMVQKNPEYVPKSKSGCKINVPDDLSSTNASGQVMGPEAERKYRESRFPWLLTDYMALYNANQVCHPWCKLDPRAQNKAENYIYRKGRGDEGACIYEDIVYEEDKDVAFKSGFYRMPTGELIYLHPNKGICRITQKEQECSCGHVHVG